MKKGLSEVYILVIIWFFTMCYFIYNSGGVEAPLMQTKMVDSCKLKDKKIAAYAHTIDSLNNINDSLAQSLDAVQHELARYVYSIDYLTEQNPKAAELFIQHYLQETE
jgi:hypothetical protein